MIRNILVLFCFSIILSSCGKDSLSDSILENVWLMQSLSIDCEDEAAEIVSGDDTGCATDPDGEVTCLKFTFSEDGTVIGEFDNDMEIGTYTVNEEANEVNVCFDGDCQIGKTVDGVMTFDFSDGDCMQNLVMVQS